MNQNYKNRTPGNLKIRGLVLVAACFVSALGTSRSFADHLNIYVQNNDVLIFGDNDDNEILVDVRWTRNRQIVFIQYSGTAELSGAFAYWGTGGVEFDISGGVDDLRIFSEGGDDVVTVAGLVTHGPHNDLIIDSTKGDNEINVEGTRVRNVLVLGGSDSERIRYSEIVARNAIVIQTENGGSDTELNDCTAVEFTFEGGELDDDAVLVDCEFDQMEFDGYEGNDLLMLGKHTFPFYRTSFSAGNITARLGEGDDSVVAYTIEFDSMDVDTAGGEDRVRLEALVGYRLGLDTGAGHDDVDIRSMHGGVNNLSSMTVNTGSGNDEVQLGYGEHPMDFTLHTLLLDLGRNNDHFNNLVNGQIARYTFDGGTGRDTHGFVPGLLSWYGDPGSTINFERWVMN